MTRSYAKRSLEVRSLQSQSLLLERLVLRTVSKTAVYTKLYLLWPISVGAKINIKRANKCQLIIRNKLLQFHSNFDTRDDSPINCFRSRPNHTEYEGPTRAYLTKVNWRGGDIVSAELFVGIFFFDAVSSVLNLVRDVQMAILHRGNFVLNKLFWKN